MTQRHTSTQDKQSLFQRILCSIFPGMLRERKEGEGYRAFFNTLVLHFRPRAVPERTLHFTLTWGLGGMAFVLVSLLLGTGLLLKFYYAVHTAILPAFLIVLMPFHFWRVRKAVEIEPDSTDFLYALADYYLKRGRFEEAKGIAEQMVSTHPSQRLGYDLLEALGVKP